MGCSMAQGARVCRGEAQKPPTAGTSLETVESKSGSGHPAWDKGGSIVGVVDNLRKSGIGGTRKFDAQYSNDNLGRLLRAQEGSLSGTTLSSATRDEQWTDGTNSKLSQTGNWLYRRLDLNGNGTFTDAGDENQSGDATFNVVMRTWSHAKMPRRAPGDQADGARSCTWSRIGEARRWRRW